MKQKTNTIEQTYWVAGELVKEITKKENQTAVVVGLVGELGGGKTTFAQGFAKALGIEEKVTSPTFNILKSYMLYVAGYRKLIHIDAYRLSKPKELLELGWENIIKDPQNIILVEWADKIKKILPKDTIWVNFEHINEEERKIEIM